MVYCTFFSFISFKELYIPYTFFQKHRLQMWGWSVFFILVFFFKWYRWRTSVLHLDPFWKKVVTIRLTERSCIIFSHIHQFRVAFIAMRGKKESSCPTYHIAVITLRRASRYRTSRPLGLFFQTSRLRDPLEKKNQHNTTQLGTSDESPWYLSTNRAFPVRMIALEPSRWIGKDHLFLPKRPEHNFLMAIKKPLDLLSAFECFISMFSFPKCPISPTLNTAGQQWTQRI